MKGPLVDSFPSYVPNFCRPGTLCQWYEMKFLLTLLTVLNPDPTVNNDDVGSVSPQGPELVPAFVASKSKYFVAPN